jgi:hypothetical protein
VFEDMIHPRIGIEFDWLATDAGGRIAFFASAGFGAVPLAAAERAAEVDAAIDTIVSWSSMGSFIDETDGNGVSSEWTDMAARGFYAYDWNHWTGPYTRVASPTKPLDIGELPPEVVGVVGLVRLRGPFAEWRTVEAPRAEREP